MKWFSVTLLFLVITLILSCGSSGGRQLESISLSSTTVGANGQQLSFVATGTFSKPPTSVTPLPVDWTSQLIAPPPSDYTYTLTTQPFVINCVTGGVLGNNPPVVVAFAPKNADAPVSGTTKAVVAGGAIPLCP
jgi:hypothetical protein